MKPAHNTVFIVGDDSAGELPLQFITIDNRYSFFEACKTLHTYLRQSFPQRYSDSYTFVDLQRDLSEGVIVGYPQAEVISL